MQDTSIKTDYPVWLFFFVACFQNKYDDLEWGTVAVLCSIPSFGTILLPLVSHKSPVGRYIKVEVGINNVFDKNYRLAEGYPEEGRNFFVTLRIFNN